MNASFARIWFGALTAGPLVRHHIHIFSFFPSMSVEMPAGSPALKFFAIKG